MSVALSGLSTWKGPLPFGLETDCECYVSLLKVITAFHTPNYIVFDFDFNFTLAAELVTIHIDLIDSVLDPEAQVEHVTRLAEHTIDHVYRDEHKRSRLP